MINITKPVMREILDLVEHGDTRRIYAFVDPAGEIQERKTSGEIVQLMQRGEVRIQ